MAQAIRVVINGQAYNDVVLQMVVRENFDIYRGTHDVVLHSIVNTTGADLDDNQMFISTAIYNARMNNNSNIVIEGREGKEFKVYLTVGEEKDLIEY